MLKERVTARNFPRLQVARSRHADRASTQGISVRGRRLGLTVQAAIKSITAAACESCCITSRSNSIVSKSAHRRSTQCAFI